MLDSDKTSTGSLRSTSASTYRRCTSIRILAVASCRLFMSTIAGSARDWELWDRNIMTSGGISNRYMSKRQRCFTGSREMHSLSSHDLKHAMRSCNSGCRRIPMSASSIAAGSRPRAQSSWQSGDDGVRPDQYSARRFGSLQITHPHRWSVVSSRNLDWGSPNPRKKGGLRSPPLRKSDGA